jgi:tetratricopeptide (TPR) repeat protein
LDEDDAPRRSWPEARRHAARWLVLAAVLTAVAVGVFWRGGATLDALTTEAVLLGVAWLASWLATPHKRPRVRLPWLWAAMGGWLALYVVPLPRGLVAVLQPRAVELADRAATTLGVAAPAWLPLALAPGEASQQAATYLLAAVGGVLVGSAVMGHGSRSVARNALLALMWFAGLASLLRVLTYNDAAAAIVPAGLTARLRGVAILNPNNAAGLANVAVAMALGRALQAAGSAQRTLYIVVASLFSVVVLLTPSRGGYLTLFAVLCMTVLALPKAAARLRRDRADIRREQLRIITSMALIVLVIGVLVALPFIEQEAKFDANSDARVLLARLLGRVLGGWLVGYGPGGIAVVAGTLTEAGMFRQDFAENWLIDAVTHGGIVLALAMVLGLALWLLRTTSQASKVTHAIGVTIALAALLIANLVDFSLQLSGPLLLFLVTAGCLERLLPDPAGNQHAERRAQPVHRWFLAGCGAALALVVPLLLHASEHVSRAAPAVLADLPLPQARDRVMSHFRHDHHAFFLLARKELATGRKDLAARDLDHALHLRPNTHVGRMFRFAVGLEQRRYATATDDLVWLYDHDSVHFPMALSVLEKFADSEAFVLTAMPRMWHLGERVGRHFERSRPDLVERMAESLRKRPIRERAPIESVRGRMYAQRGHLRAADAVATVLLVDPATRQAGWRIQAHVLWQTPGQQRTAHMLFADLCARQPNDDDCFNAMAALRTAQRPRDLLAYLSRHRDQLLSSSNMAVEYWRATAQAHLEMHNFEEATVAARNAYGLDRQSTYCALLLAEALGHVGQHEEQRAVLNKAREKDPHNVNVLTMLRRVEDGLPPELRTLPPEATLVAP